jgi:threonine dehydratase
MAFKFNKQCFVVMGEGSSKCKIDAVKAYHGQVVFCPNTVKDRAETTVKVTQYNGAHMIDPYNDWDVIAG